MDENDEPVVIDKALAIVPFDGIEVKTDRQVGLDLLVEQSGPGGDFRTAVKKQFGSLADRIGPRGLAFGRRRPARSTAGSPPAKGGRWPGWSSPSKTFCA